MGTTDEKVKAGVGVVVCRNQKVLVGIRKKSHGAGCWAFPGGHIEKTDKHLKAAGEREVFEETGIICNIFKPDHYRDDLFTTFDSLAKDGKGDYLTTYLVAEYLFGGNHILVNGEEVIQGREQDKCSSWHWKSLEELAQTVLSQKDNQWIPINQVAFYLRNLWRQS